MTRLRLLCTIRRLGIKHRYTGLLLSIYLYGQMGEEDHSGVSYLIEDLLLVVLNSITLYKKVIFLDVN